MMTRYNFNSSIVFRLYESTFSFLIDLINFLFINLKSLQGLNKSHYLSSQEDEDSKDGRSNDRDRKKESNKKDKSESSKKEKKEKRKMTTIDPYLLLSFVYFDQTHTGYIIDKDLEDIVNMLSLNLSRAQVRIIQI